MGKACKYLRSGRRCLIGCTPYAVLCHQFSQYGKCRFGNSCLRIHRIGPPKPDCKYLRSGRPCFSGCTPTKILCHAFSKYGQCREENSCTRIHASGPSNDRRRSRSRSSSEAPPKAAPAPKRAPLTQLTRSLRALGIDPKCTFINGKMISSMYRVRALDLHPDKGCDASGNSEAMKKLNGARDYLMNHFGSQ